MLPAELGANEIYFMAVLFDNDVKFITANT